jgi:hypothetical protein
VRALLIGALAPTLVGCSCFLAPQASIGGCTDANGFACFDRTAASQPVEPKLASFRTDSATIEIKSTLVAKTEKPSSAYARDRTHLVIKTAKPTMIAATEPSASRVPLSPRSLKTRLQSASNAAADSDKTQAEPEANNKDRSNHSDTMLRRDAEKITPASPNAPLTESAQNQPYTAWVVSETTSPVDYSALITAVIQSTSSMKDASNTLALRCVASRTELLLRTEGAWRATHDSEVQVDYQINDEPFVRLQWTLSADGKTASYKGDVVGLLRSLPEGARLKISVFDRQGLGQEATFQLTGLDSVRKKIGLACKWRPTARG